MDGLRQADLRAGMRLLQAVSAAGTDRPAFAQACVAALPELVASEITTLSVCDLRSGHRSVIGSPDSRLGDEERACFDRHFGEHPLVRFHAYQQGRGIHRISDSLRFSQFRNTALYSEYYQRIGIDHVVALPIQVDDHTLISFVLNRSRRDFSDRECAALDLVREPLAQMYRRARSMEQAQAALADLNTLFERCGSAWMRLGRGRELQAASTQALTWVAAHTGAAPRVGQPLAPVLDRWVSQALVPMNGAAPGAKPAAAPPELLLTRAGDRLRLQLLPRVAHGSIGSISDEGSVFVLLEQRLSPVHAARFDDLPLSARETEVMHWLAAAKTDREIAALLGLSHRTVQKHLERIYEKLGVETRTAAVMRALAIGAPAAG